MSKLKVLPVILPTLVCEIIAVFAQTDQRLPLNFALQVNGQVRLAADRRPAENILVRIESFSGGLISQVTTDRGGKFTFTGLSPTQYIVTVHAPGYVDVREDVNLATANSSFLNIELVADKNSLGGGNKDNIDLSGLSVIDANIPLEAQNEFAKGKALLATGENQDKLNQAIQHFEKAIAIYPKYLEAHILFGLAEMDLNRWERAEKPLLEAIKINPQASTAYFALGEVYRLEKKYVEAVKILLTGIKLNDQSVQAHHSLAKTFWEMAPTLKDEKQKNIALESAWQEINKTLLLKPDLADGHLLAGNLLLRARRAKDALSHFEEYLKLEPKGEFAGQTQILVNKIRQELEKTEKTK